MRTLLVKFKKSVKVVSAMAEEAKNMADLEKSAILPIKKLI